MFYFLLLPFRSNVSGNCLYSSISMVLVGDNSLITTLRLMTSIELFLNADYYCRHPCLISLFHSHKNIFRSLSGMLAMCVSFEAMDAAGNIASSNLLWKEALLNCADNRWRSFICLLALASVTSRTIYSYYPDFDSCSEKCQLLFNQRIDPWSLKSELTNFAHIRILFCYEGLLDSFSSFQHNNYVPLLSYQKGLRENALFLLLNQTKVQLCLNCHF